MKGMIRYMKSISLVSVDETKLIKGNVYQVRYHRNESTFSFNGILVNTERDSITFSRFVKGSGLSEISFNLFELLTDIDDIVPLIPLTTSSELFQENESTNSEEATIYCEEPETPSPNITIESEEQETYVESRIIDNSEMVDFSPSIDDYDIPSPDNYRFDFS